MGIPSVLFGLLLSGWIAFIPGAMAGHADFRQLYAAGHIVRSGMTRQLYDYDVQKEFQDRFVSPEAIALPFIRPAYQAVLFVPFTFLSYRTSYWVMLGINIGLLTLSFQLLSPYLLNLRAIWKWLPVAIFASFLPTGAAFIQGQDSILLLTLFAGALVALLKGKEFAAGALIAVGLFKFQLVIPVALLLLIWRRWRFSAGFASMAAMLTCFSIWLTGTEQIGLYIRSVLSMGTNLRMGSEPKLFSYPLHVQMMANLHGLIFGLTRGRISNVLQLAIVAILSFTFFGWTAFRGRRVKNGPELLVRAIPCGVLVSYYAFVHDLSVLLLPCAIVLNQTLVFAGSDDGARCLQTLSALLVFVAPVMQVFFPNYLYLAAFASLLLLISLWSSHEVSIAESIS